MDLAAERRRLQAEHAAEQQEKHDAERPVVAPPPSNQTVSVRVISMLFVLVGLSLLSAGYWLLGRPKPPDRDNLADSYSQTLPLAELHDLGGMYVGVAEWDWPGHNSAKVASGTCDQLASQLTLSPVGTLLLRDPNGVFVVECGLR
jgi:hypothetical protein